ncbi:DUF6599 family protein, partial [Verrucomicrobiota bacterium]
MINRIKIWRFSICLILVLSSCTVLTFHRGLDLVDTLPNLKRLNHLTVRERPTVYAGDNLYEYINGAAELFHEYDFRKVITEELTVMETGESIIIDIYNMGRLESAFGIFSRHRLPDSEYFDSGTECQYSEPILCMYKDRFFVQLAGSRPFPGLKNMLLQIAGEIEHQIKGVSHKPGELAFLPVKGRIPHSERYIKKDVLGFGFLSDAWFADYDVGGEQITLMYICCESKDKSREIFQKFRAENKKARDKTFPSADACFTGGDGPGKTFTVC